MTWWTNQLINANGEIVGDDCPCCDCLLPTPGISLDDFFEEMCINPFYGWQMSQNPNDRDKRDTPIPGGFDDTPCDRLVYERCRNGCQIAGRQEICQAIIEAERMFANQAKYWPTPHQVCDEISFACGFRGGELALGYGKVLALGSIAYDHIDTLTIADEDFHDTNNDGVLDTLILDLAKPTAVTDPNDVVILLDEDCHFGYCGRELRPICVRANPNDTSLLRVEIPVWLMVDRENFDWVNPKPVDPNILANYMRTVKFYRKYVDGRNAVRIMRSSGRFSCGCGNETADCFTCDTGTACIVDSDYGVIRMNLSNGGDCGCWCDQCAERLCIRYVSGVCNGQWDRWIARLAASIINRDVCCDATGSLVKYWAQEFIQTDSRGRITTPLSSGESANYFGTRRAGVELNRQLRGQRRRKIIMI